MTTREYVVFSFALLQSGIAAWGLEQPGGQLPPGANAANVDFVRAHKAAIEKLDATAQSTCDEVGDSDDRDSDDDK